MKVFNTGTRIIVFVVIISSFLLSIIVLFFTQAEVTRATEQVIQEKENKITEIASRTELRMQDATKILQLAAKLDDVRNVLYASSVSEEYRGLPPDLDPEKRQVARDLLSVYQDFETVAFILPNGDIYFVEPYSAQQNLPRLNFAYREWYQGVIASQDTHVGDVILSAATGHRVVPIAVAVHSSENDSLAGIFVGALDLEVSQQKLRETTLGANEYVLIVDNKGSIIADSRIGTIEINQLSSALNLSAVNKALNGEAGSSTEMIDDVNTFVAYRPIQASTSNWAIVSLQPYDNTFSTVNAIFYQSVITVALITIVSGVSGYFLYRSFKNNNTLTHRLEVLNEDLKDKSVKLLQLDREKEEFSAMITHELKTPLVPIVGYSELLLDGTLGELTDKQKEKLQVIYNSASSLSRLISDLLDVRKLELGKFKMDISDAKIQEIVAQCVDGLRLQSQVKGINITYSVQDNLRVKCDAKRIQQVLYNLLTNAIKFAPSETGKIELLASKQTENDQQSHILFTIKDNGQGIPKVKQQDLFKKFYQADTSLSRTAGGTGLGLAISKGIVEAHGGKIWCESEGIEGKGATFYFTIPYNTSEKKNNAATDDTGAMITQNNTPETGARLK